MTGSNSHGLVLVVEDEAPIADLERMYLSKAGFGVHVVSDGAAALAAVAALQPAAMLLDIGIPQIDGIEVCKRLRADGNWLPILFVTARDDEVDRVLGLELGGDDYITKPFSPKEMVARVRSALRRSQVAVTGGSDIVALGAVSLDRASRRVFVGDAEVEFTATEFDLLSHLMSRPGRVITREQLLSEVWGYAAYVSNRTVDTHIAQLRAKLGEHSFIRTVRGVGYSAEPVAK